MTLAEDELVPPSLWPHKEYHLLEITFDSESVSAVGQDPQDQLGGVCPSNCSENVNTPCMVGLGLSDFMFESRDSAPATVCDRTGTEHQTRGEPNPESCQWPLRSSGKNPN